MFIPVHTDAPIYHPPIGTVGLILANVATFFITQGGTADAGWLLRFGNGLHPAEWISSAFLHFGPMHLIGNMVFLWAFGLLIEGKLGLLRFLGLYLSLCALTGCILQTLMLFSFHSPGAGGASTVLFGLMVICLLWAPQNNFTVILLSAYWGMVRVYHWEITVKWFSLSYLLLNFFTAWLTGFSMSSEVLHLTGAIAGVPVGILFLKWNWVDCEGWDLLSLWKKGFAQPGVDSFWGWKEKASTEITRTQAPATAMTPKSQLRRIEQQIDRGEHFSAVQNYVSFRRKTPTTPPLSMARIRLLIHAAREQQQWSELTWLLEREYLPQGPKDRIPATLMLAGIQVRYLQRPRAAVRTLSALSTTELSPLQQQLVLKIHQSARTQIDEGVIEIATN